MIYYEQEDKTIVIPSGFTNQTYQDGFSCGYNIGYEKGWDDAHNENENQ